MALCVKFVIIAIITIAMGILLGWAILRPHYPQFILKDVTLSCLNFSNPSKLTANMQVTLSTINPNENMGVYFEKLDTIASYHNQQITLATKLPKTYLGNKGMSTWSPFLYGDDVPLSPYVAADLIEDMNRGMVPLDIKVDGTLKYQVGSLIMTNDFQLMVNCSAYVQVDSQRKGLLVYSGAKFVLEQRCKVKEWSFIN